MIKDYIIATGNNTLDLRNSVKHFMDVGWQPFGGVSHAVAGTHTSEYSQAMVKYEQPVIEEPKEESTPWNDISDVAKKANVAISSLNGINMPFYYATRLNGIQRNLQELIKDISNDANTI